MNFCRAVSVWLLLFVMGCTSTRVVRLDTGQGRPLEYVPAAWNASVAVSEDEFEEALVRLALEVPLSIRPFQAGGWVRASSPGYGAAADIEVRHIP